MVQEVAWSAGEVSVTSTGGEQFNAPRLLITLPLGVLQRNDVTFTPRLVSKEEASGEATNTTGHHGTVHGAIATGLRASHEIQCSTGTQQ